MKLLLLLLDFVVLCTGAAADRFAGSQDRMQQAHAHPRVIDGVTIAHPALNRALSSRLASRNHALQREERVASAAGTERGRYTRCIINGVVAPELRLDERVQGSAQLPQRLMLQEIRMRCEVVECCNRGGHIGSAKANRLLLRRWLLSCRQHWVPTSRQRPRFLVIRLVFSLLVLSHEASESPLRVARVCVCVRAVRAWRGSMR